jgi:serine/threonine-protein kinase RsbW/sigma-B regulation protein RsbU (phosphoserine phosphatase)
VAPAGLDGDLDQRVAGGLGIHLVKALMDDVRYHRDGALNCLTFVKQLGERDRQPGGAGGQADER